MKIVGYIILLFVMILNVLNGFAQKKEYVTYKLNSEPPVIDGRFNDQAWKELEWMNKFVQVEPYEGKEPSQNTKFKMLHSNEELYIAIRAYDSNPDSIVKRLSRRDKLDG